MVSQVSAAIPDAVNRALQTASNATGTSFDYLLKTAIRESSLDPNARVERTSATGLFQFIDSTWLQMVKEEGPRFGLGDLADKIERRPSGYVASDPAARASILALRNDPTISAEMAGAFTKRNADFLAERIGRKATDGELYAAHFLGAAGAAHLIEAKSTAPAADASAVFPAAAASNRTIFFDRAGVARSLGEVYAILTRDRPAGMPRPPTPTALAAASPAAGTPAPTTHAAAPTTGEAVMRLPPGLAARTLASAAPASATRGAFAFADPRRENPAAAAVTAMALRSEAPAPHGRYAPQGDAAAPASARPQIVASAVTPRGRFAPQPA